MDKNDIFRLWLNIFRSGSKDLVNDKNLFSELWKNLPSPLRNEVIRLISRDNDKRWSKK